jgi:peptidoglycan/xylan/chitin deacetylase (PgdA/CDA1 family)
MTSSPLPTKTIPATLTPTPRTPPSLPAPYQNDTLTPFGTPHPYFQDTCQYLLDKWSSTNSTPRTVVMVIMFHSITDNTITNSSQISTYRFRGLMSTLHDEGFQAITTAQLANFMESNARIPERSVLLVVDDRKNPDYFNNLFREYWDKYQWPVVNGWISLYGENDPFLAGNVSLSEEGWVDYQAHGYFHNTPIGPDSTDAYILGELQKPIDLFKASFHKTPIAVIWPGGGFTPHAAAVARELGYRLGFTINPRGPIMFNWVPLGDSSDPQRPTWLADGPVNDPLMVLPRYWDTDAIKHIDQVVQVGQEAASYAAVNKATEMEYYDIVCASHYGPIP